MHQKCNPNTLRHLDEAITTAKAVHSPEAIRVAAKGLNLLSWLPEPSPADLFREVAK